MPSSVTTAGLPTHHEFQYIIDRIVKAAPEKPSDILHLDKRGQKGIAIAWNTREHYCDVEIFNNQVDFMISPDRKRTSFVTTDFECVDEGIEALVTALNSSIKTAHN